jgi:hypothetical protein
VQQLGWQVQQSYSSGLRFFACGYAIMVHA